MKIFVVGAAGTLGKIISDELQKRHEVVKGGRKSGDIHLNLADPDSILEAFKKIGHLDAVVSAAGQVNFMPLKEIKPALIDASVYGLGLKDKLMGQVNLALIARDFLNDGGSITLMSGILSDEYILAGSSASMVNSAIEGFVKSSAIELLRGLRINAVSPTVVKESLKEYGDSFRGFEPVSGIKVANAVIRSIEGLQTGQIYKVF